MEGKGMPSSRPWPQHIPFKELKACPKCGSRELKKIHDRRYPDKEGISRVVIYRCPKGHETFHKQLVVKQFGVPDPDFWRG
jgi:hypothetical protein